MAAVEIRADELEPGMRAVYTFRQSDHVVVDVSPVFFGKVMVQWKHMDGPVMYDRDAGILIEFPEPTIEDYQAALREYINLPSNNQAMGSLSPLFRIMKQHHIDPDQLSG